MWPFCLLLTNQLFSREFSLMSNRLSSAGMGGIVWHLEVAQCSCSGLFIAWMDIDAYSWASYKEREMLIRGWPGSEGLYSWRQAEGRTLYSPILNSCVFTAANGVSSWGRKTVQHSCPDEQWTCQPPCKTTIYSGYTCQQNKSLPWLNIYIFTNVNCMSLKVGNINLLWTSHNSEQVWWRINVFRLLWLRMWE